MPHKRGAGKNCHPDPAGQRGERRFGGAVEPARTHEQQTRTSPQPCVVPSSSCRPTRPHQPPTAAHGRPHAAPAAARTPPVARMDAARRPGSPPTTDALCRGRAHLCPRLAAYYPFSWGHLHYARLTEACNRAGHYRYRSTCRPPASSAGRRRAGQAGSPGRHY